MLVFVSSLPKQQHLPIFSFEPGNLTAGRTNLQSWYPPRGLGTARGSAVLSWSFYSMAFTSAVFQLAWWPCFLNKNLHESPSIYTQRESQVCRSCLPPFVPHAKISTLFWVFQPLESPKKPHPSSTEWAFSPSLLWPWKKTQKSNKKQNTKLTSPCRFAPESSLLSDLIIYSQVMLF